MADAQPNETSKVVIAGAGPVGLALALGLARRGIGSVVLEKKEALSKHSKAVLVTVRTCEILLEWGVLEAFRDNSEWIDEVQVHDVSRGRVALTLNFKHLRPISAAAGVCVLPQDETERLLCEACQSSGLVDIRFGHEVVAFDSGGDGVRTRVRSGSNQYVIESSFLCGCDGAHSTVRDALGMELQGKTYDAHAKLADVLIKDDRDQLPWPRVDFAQANLSAVVRFRPGYWRIIFAGPGKHNGSDPTPEFIQAKVDELIGQGPAEIVWASSFHIHCRNAPHFRVDRVLLLGDAAHLNSPAGGQGMNAGIQDAHNLAWKLAAATKLQDPEILLKSYDAERYDAITHTVDVATDRLTRFGVLGAPWQRSIGLAVIRWLSQFAGIQRKMGMGLGMLTHRYDEGDLIDRSGGRLCPDVDLGDGLRLRAAIGDDGGLVEVVRNGAKLCIGDATYDLSVSAGREMAKAGGPWLAVRPDHVIAYSGGSRERAEEMIRRWSRI